MTLFKNMADTDKSMTGLRPYFSATTPHVTAVSPGRTPRVNDIAKRLAISPCTPESLQRGSVVGSGMLPCLLRQRMPSRISSKPTSSTASVQGKNVTTTKHMTTMRILRLVHFCAGSGSESGGKVAASEPSLLERAESSGRRSRSWLLSPWACDWAGFAVIFSAGPNCSVKRTAFPWLIGSRVCCTRKCWRRLVRRDYGQTNRLAPSWLV